MHGSAKALARKEQFMAEIARTPAFRLDDIHDLSKDEVRERTMEKFSTMVSISSNRLSTSCHRAGVGWLAVAGHLSRPLPVTRS